MKLQQQTTVRAAYPRMLIWIPNPFFGWDRSRYAPTGPARLIYLDPTSQGAALPLLRWTTREVLR